MEEINERLEKIEKDIAEIKKVLYSKDKDTNITCKCGYSWKTKSKLKYVICPSCRNAVINPLFNDEKENKEMQEM